MNTTREIDTDVRLRGWTERIEGESADLEITSSIPDRLEAILQLRDVQDLAPVARVIAL